MSEAILKDLLGDRQDVVRMDAKETINRKKSL